MERYGFIPSYGDAVTIGTAFTSNSVPMLSSIIHVGTAGNLVWLNAHGDPQWSPGLLADTEYYIGATQIVASATVNGVARTTTATNLSWRAINQLYNTP